MFGFARSHSAMLTRCSIWVDVRVLWMVRWYGLNPADISILLTLFFDTLMTIHQTLTLTHFDTLTMIWQQFSALCKHFPPTEQQQQTLMWPSRFARIKLYSIGKKKHLKSFNKVMTVDESHINKRYFWYERFLAWKHLLIPIIEK